MRGHHDCDFGPLGRHCQNMSPFGRFGPAFGGFGCGRGHHGPPEFGHRCSPGGHGLHGSGFFKPRPWDHYGPGPYSEEESDNCCQDYGGCRRGPCPRKERGPNGPPGCADFEHDPREGRGYGTQPPYCRRRRGHSRDHSPHGRHDGGPRGRHGLCHGPPHYMPGPHEVKDRHDHCVPCYGPPGHGTRHWSRLGHGGERRPGGHHGDHSCEPFGLDFGHFGPHRRPFGPRNRQGPYEQCGRRHNHSEEESGNETERRGRKNRPCCRKNKDQNRDDTVLVQRIVVENAPRCNSV